MVRQKEEDGLLKPTLTIIHLKDTEDLTRETVSGDKKEEMGLRNSRK